MHSFPVSLLPTSSTLILRCSGACTRNSLIDSIRVWMCSTSLPQQQRWQGTALQWVEHQQQLNQHWFENQQGMFNHFQQANQQWANTAMAGVQQAQLGVKQWYDFAASTQTTVANMLAGSEHRQAMVVEQAMTRATTKRWINKLMIIGLVMLGMLALFGCSFFAMMHLY